MKFVYVTVLLGSCSMLPVMCLWRCLEVCVL